MKAFQDGMRIAQLKITPEMVAQLFKPSGARLIRVADKALPDDAEVYQSGIETTGTGDRLFYLLLTSESFRMVHGNEMIPVLSAVVFESVDITDDEHIAALRAQFVEPVASKGDDHAV